MYEYECANVQYSKFSFGGYAAAATRENDNKTIFDLCSDARADGLPSMDQKLWSNGVKAGENLYKTI